MTILYALLVLLARMLVMTLLYSYSPKIIQIKDFFLKRQLLKVLPVKVNNKYKKKVCS